LKTPSILLAEVERKVYAATETQPAASLQKKEKVVFKQFIYDAVVFATLAHQHVGRHGKKTPKTPQARAALDVG